MPLGTLDRTAPPLFNQGQSALSKLIFFGALSLFLMVADARFHIVQPIRAGIGAVLYPVQWVALKPVQAVLGGGRYFEDLQVAQRNEEDARKALMMQAERAAQADTLAQDNARLRELLELRQATTTPGRAAEVLYDAADPYTRKIVIDQGMTQGVVAGSPVIDARGVQNTRTGVRSVAFGDASAHGGGLELRFMAANADLQEGDLLSTSGVDGIYPTGLPVAKIERIERRADSAFARIYCVPLAHVTAARYVLVLEPTGAPTAPPPAPPATTQRKRPEGKPGAGKNEKKPGERR